MQHLQPNTTLQGGKYRIERVLGQGGFGNTYVGFNTEFEETVAIKEFFMKGVTERDETTCDVSVSNADNVGQFEEQREKFKKEARRLRKLKNEHIVKVHDLFEENGTAYYVMDYIDGESLAERMKKTEHPFSEAEVRNILSQILEALKEVHQNEIWHLDLKPGNIMIDKGGNAYLIDFGASKQIRANGSMTTSTALCYTPGYAPNEQIGQMYDRFGPWTDIYALGATIYNLLTNKKPPMAIDIEEDEEDAFEFPTNISNDMRKLVVWMMQPKRKARPQSASAVLERLVVKQHEESEKRAAVEPVDTEETIVMQPKVSKEVKNSTRANICNGHKYIDLGLGVYWADMNIGASSPEEIGIGYIWGDSNGWIIKETKESIFKRLYNYKPQVDVISGNDRYDTSTNMWGSCWRMPKPSDFEELVSKCEFIIIDEEHVKLKGPNGNYIVLHIGAYWTGERMISFEIWRKSKNNQDIYKFWDRSRWNHLKTFCLIRPVLDKTV